MFYQKELSVESLKRSAPSVFTESARSTTSNQYLHIPTVKILEALIKNDFIPVAAKQTRSRTNIEHAKHVLHFSHRSIADRLTLKQELPLIRVQNSHDGLSSFQIDTGFYRLVCSNGLVMPAGRINSARIIHKIGMENDVIEASYRVLNSFDSELRKVETLKGIELNREEQSILADSASRIVFGAETIEANAKNGRMLSETLNLPRRLEDKKSDIWTVFNRIQENAIKGGRRIYSASGQFRKMREVNSIDREKQINVELMTLALEMGKLKGAQFESA